MAAPVVDEKAEANLIGDPSLGIARRRRPASEEPSGRRQDERPARPNFKLMDHLCSSQTGLSATPSAANTERAEAKRANNPRAFRGGPRFRVYHVSLPSGT